MVLLPLEVTRNALDKAGLLGTPFLPANFHPKVLLQVDFPTTGATVALGNTLQAADGKEEPVVSFVAEVSRATPACLRRCHYTLEYTSACISCSHWPVPTSPCPR